MGFFAALHQVDVHELLRDIKAEMEHPSVQTYVYKETLQDYIYRRFFRAGVVIVLTVGCLWGAINLLQIALANNFLQLRLLPAIHAHAHAMVFGWVGMFVMGFAYQSFPRFKNTTLWRPGLANLSFYLFAAGILTRMAADILLPALSAVALGIFSAIVEVTAVVLFMLVLYRTAQKSLEPRNPYEKFIASSFLWFLLGTILSAVFFFAKATAHSERDLIMRIALIDGPLRDIQLLGFTALIIAGVSQRFVPQVYGLERPSHDRRNLIFWLMNGSLVLNIISYVLLLITRQLYFAIGLELAYLLMPVWAVLLALQLGVFTAPSQPDRTFKFIRAAYVWLLIASGMMPLFPLYGAATHQVFAHFLYGLASPCFYGGFRQLDDYGSFVPSGPHSGWYRLQANELPVATFHSVQCGLAGRVLLQVLTDFLPNIAYPLMGFTGFIELAALFWWGVELWRTMNRAARGRMAALTMPFPAPVR